MSETVKARVYTRTVDGSTGHEVVEAETPEEARKKARKRSRVAEAVDVREYEEGVINHPDLDKSELKD
jgi:hypothetical protein